MPAEPGKRTFGRACGPMQTLLVAPVGSICAGRMNSVQRGRPPIRIAGMVLVLICR